MGKKAISRKDFIKGCSATVGLMSLGLSTPAEVKAENIYPDNLGSAASRSNANTRRGSWVADAENKGPGDVTLVSATSKCAIILDDKANSAIKQAAEFLALDIEKISGYKPPVTHSVKDGYTSIYIETYGSDGIPAGIKAKLASKHEAYIIKTLGNDVWLVGSDFRGTAFAVYAFAERLGIDPLYHWTGYQPQKYSTLILKATDHYSPPPVFKYRGFFHDDEDVLPRPFERSGYPLRIGDISMDWYHRYFETTLRLGMNMTAPVCRVHRRYEIQKCASDWGLYYTSHHYDILLSNPFGIERFRLAEKRGVSTDWDWFKNKQNMIKYWRGGVEENKEINCIWPVGLRGTDDHAYGFPPNTPANIQADVFAEAINTQVDTVKSVTGKKSEQLFHFTMYTEMLEKYEQHPELFNVPEDVMIIWPDNDDGLMRSLPATKGKWKHGVYYHLAYFGKNISKQGPHVIPPARIAEEFKKIKSAGATEFLLVNVSEMREHVMEMRMIADLAKDDAMYKDAALANSFTKWWCNEYFDTNEVALKQKIYDKYFDIFDSSEKVWFGNDLVKDILYALSSKIKHKEFKMPETDKFNQLAAKLLKYRAIMLDIASAQKGMDRTQAQFFYENVTLGLLMDYRPCQAAELLVKALASNNNGQLWQYVNEAILPLEKLEIELLKGEHTPFEKWYAETWIKNETSPLNYHRAYQQLREFIATGGNLPKTVPVAGGHNIPGAQLWNDYMAAADKITTVY